MGRLEGKCFIKRAGWRAATNILEPAGNWYEIGTKPTQDHNDEGRPDGRPSRSRSAGLQGSCKSYALVGRDSGGGIRTRDLRVMSENAHLDAKLCAS